MPANRPRRPAWQQALILSAIAAVLAVGGLFLLGLPGAAFMEIATPLAQLFSPRLLGGDQVWPAAILLSLVGPFAILPSYALAARIVAPRAQRFVLTACLAVIANIGLAVAVLAIGGS